MQLRRRFGSLTTSNLLTTPNLLTAPNLLTIPLRTRQALLQSSATPREWTPVVLGCAREALDGARMALVGGACWMRLDGAWMRLDTLGCAWMRLDEPHACALPRGSASSRALSCPHARRTVPARRRPAAPGSDLQSTVTHRWPQGCVLRATSLFRSHRRVPRTLHTQLAERVATSERCRKCS